MRDVPQLLVTNEPLTSVPAGRLLQPLGSEEFCAVSSRVCRTRWGVSPGPLFRCVRFPHLLNHSCPCHWFRALYSVLSLGKCGLCKPAECSPTHPNLPTVLKELFSPQMVRLQWKLGREGIYKKTGRGLPCWVTVLVGPLRTQSSCRRNISFMAKKQKIPLFCSRGEGAVLADD